MNGPNDNIVVYHSQGERAFDLWVWNSGGWIVILAVILIPTLAILFLKYMDYRRKGYWD